MEEQRGVAVQVLGPVTVTIDGEKVDPGSDKPRQLLALLATHPGRSLTTEGLIDGLWGEEPPATARKALQVHVSNLRKALGERTISTEEGGYRLEAEIDAVEFESRLARALVEVGHDPVAALAEIDIALGMWRGDAFADLGGLDALRPETARLTELRLRATEVRIQAEIDMGRHHEVLTELDPLIAANPYREELRAFKMLALYRAGRQAEALRVFRAASEFLGGELGIEPGLALRQLEQRILEQDPALELTPRTSEAKKRVVGLPARRDDLIGREHDLTQVTENLERHRLVTLTGVGGCGKTRLAIETAHLLTADFPDGVYFVDLTTTLDTETVVSVFLTALDLTRLRGVEELDQFTNFLADKVSLIVVDNCEQVLDAVGDVIDETLDGCPNVRFLTTSREALAVPGELAWRVPSLDLDGPDSPAVRLFSTRAAQAEPTFELTASNVDDVIEICRRLDGVPLAIELAAARMRTMTPAEVRQRLDDRFLLLTGGRRRGSQRQQTLQGAVEWSYDLLTEAERTMLKRLSVFSGGFEIGDVPAVTGFDPLAAVDLVDSLTAKSLLTFSTEEDGSRRGRMLETIRLFALERLMEAGEIEKTRDAHREAFLGPFTGVPFMKVAYDSQVEARVNREMGNILAAVDWAVADGRRKEAALMVARISGTLLWQGGILQYRDLLGDDYDLVPAEEALLLCGLTMLSYATWSGGGEELAARARAIETDVVLDDLFVPQLAEMDLAPAEGAAERLVRLDALLNLAERSPSRERNVGAVQFRRAGQLYSEGRLDAALDATMASIAPLGYEYSMVTAAIALRVHLGLSGEANLLREEVEEYWRAFGFTDRYVRQSEFEQDVYWGICQIGTGRAQEAGRRIATSARRHVDGRLPMQEGDYLLLFAAYRTDIGDRERALQMVGETLTFAGTLEWIVWPHVGNWGPDDFIASNQEWRRKQIQRSEDIATVTETMATLLSEEIAFWEG